MINIVPQPGDYAKLWEMNPLACEQLKVIALMRLLEEERSQSEELRARIIRLGYEESKTLDLLEDVVPFPEE